MYFNYAKVFVIFILICQFHQTIPNHNDVFIDSIKVESQAIRIYPKTFNNSQMEHYHADRNEIEW